MHNCHCTCNIPPSFVHSTQVGQLGHGIGLMGSLNGFASLFHLEVAPTWNTHAFKMIYMLPVADRSQFFISPCLINPTAAGQAQHFLPSIGKTSLPDWNMAVVLPVHAGDATDASSAGTPAVVSIPPAEELVPSIDLTSAKGTETLDPKKEPTLLTKKESTSPIKKGSNSPSKKDFVSPMEVTVTLNTEDAGDHEQKNLEVPVRKSPPCYGPNNSARRANRRKNGSPGPTTRQSSPPLLTPDSRSPASSRPASPFSPASSPAARRHSHAEVTVPAARSVSQRRPSAPVVSAPSPTPAFTHPQLVAHPLRNSRSMKDTREGARSESHDECTSATEICVSNRSKQLQNIELICV